MPLSKEKQAEKMREYRKTVLPKNGSVIPKLDDLQPWARFVLGEPDKARKICKQLRERNLLEHVRYGIWGPSFDIIEEALECVK